MSKSHLFHIFTYARQKGPYLSILGTFFFLCLAEGSLLVFLVLRFVPGTLWQTLVLSAPGLFVVGMFGRLLFPLWTHHRLFATTLELRYGLDFHARLSLAEIAGAQPAQEKIGAFPVPRYDAARKRLSLAFSDRGQVLLSLAHSRPFRLGLRRSYLVEQLLISLDQREEFLTELDLARDHLPGVASHATPGAGNEPELPVRLPSLDTRPDLPRLVDDAPVALRVEHLTRHYAGIVAVEDLNLAVKRGEIYGFLGPNGAGKSTTIKMLVGLLMPTAGSAWLAGHNVWSEPLQAKRALGYVADRALLYDRLTGREFLAFLAQLRGLPRQLSASRIAELLDLLELADQADRLCGSYSFGMKRKLSLAGALLHQPPVLILDEPLNGLDPLSSRRLKDLFLRLAAQGTTIFLSTHDLATAESICHRVGILQRGRLLAEGSAAELLTLAAAPDLESVFLALTAQREEVAR